MQWFAYLAFNESAEPIQTAARLFLCLNVSIKAEDHLILPPKPKKMFWRRGNAATDGSDLIRRMLQLQELAIFAALVALCIMISMFNETYKPDSIFENVLYLIFELSTLGWAFYIWKDYKKNHVQS